MTGEQLTVDQSPVRPRPAAAQTPAKRVALFGLFGCGNFGNDGSLETMLGFLRRERPEADLVCVCDQPAAVSEATGLRTVPISPSRHYVGLPRKLDRLLLRLPGKAVDLAIACRTLSRVDALVVPGTGILDDFGERPYGMPLDILLWMAVARLFGVRIAMASIGAGPIRHSLSRRLMVAAARCAHYRSYRDEISRSFMASAGLDTRGDRIRPDLVFGLAEPEVRGPDPRAGLTVGVGVMSYYGWYGFASGGDAIFETYCRKMAAFIRHALDAGHRVRLLTGEVEDRVAVERISALLAEQGEIPADRIVSEPIASLRDLMVQAARTDLVVATRFHNVVCALKVGRPTISLGYARKNDVLMERMGMGEFCHHVETFDLAALIAHYDRLAAEHEAYRRLITARCNELRDEHRAQEADLLAWL